VKTEMSLHVLAYNLKRLLALLGIATLMDAIRAYALLLTLQRLFWPVALLTRSKARKKIRGPHNAPWRFPFSLCT
jgi:transposase